MYSRAAPALPAMVSPQVATLATGGETTPRRVGSSKPNPPPLLTLFPVIFTFPEFVERLKNLDNHMAMSFHLERTYLLKIINYFDKICYFVWVFSRFFCWCVNPSGFWSAEHLSVHRNGTCIWPFQSLLILRSIHMTLLRRILREPVFSGHPILSGH